MIAQPAQPVLVTTSATKADFFIVERNNGIMVSVRMLAPVRPPLVGTAQGAVPLSERHTHIALIFVAELPQILREDEVLPCDALPGVGGTDFAFKGVKAIGLA